MLAVCAVLAAPAGVAAAEPPTNDFWTRPTLTGDWGGLRSRLEDRGVTFALEYTTDLLANVRSRSAAARPAWVTSIPR